MIVLDTHTWIWWASDPPRLGRRGRITIDRSPLEWLEQALALPRVELLSMTPAIAVKATQLGTFHGDPADRLIVATAILHAATLVSRDQNIRAFAAVASVW